MLGRTLPKGCNVVPETSGISEAHIKRFQDRARFHFVVSYVVLIGILVLFGLAVYIFLFAQEIDKSKGSIQVLQELQTGKVDETPIVKATEDEVNILLNQFRAGTTTFQRVAIAEQEFYDANTKLKLFDKQIQLMNESGYVADIDTPSSKEELTIVAEGKTQLKQAQAQILTLLQSEYAAGVNVTQADVLEAQRVVDQTNLELELAQQRAAAALPAAQIKQVATSLDTIELVRTSLVRFGGVAVILFLISLLTPIYRYNVRLATFYQARADTLLLSRDTHVDDFSEMTRLMTPTYGFDKEPRTPVESLASAVKDASGIVKG